MWQIGREDHRSKESGLPIACSVTGDESVYVPEGTLLMAVLTENHQVLLVDVPGSW